MFRAAMAGKSGRRLAAFLFWLAFAGAFVLAVMPHPPEFPGHPSDKIQHIAAFLVLTALGSWAYPDTPKLRLLAGLSLFGAAIEAIQSIPQLNRDSDILDWVADTASTAVALVLLAGVAYARSRR
jgi:VanZ family protein